MYADIPACCYPITTSKANVSQFDMYDSYAPTFEKAVTGAVDTATGEQLMGAKGIMCSYNAVNGVPSCASRWMQTEILRGNWSFNGWVQCTHAVTSPPPVFLINQSG